MQTLFLHWLNDPSGALYELFNRSIFYILVAVAGSVVTYFWTKIKFSARNQWFRLFNQSISYEGADVYNGLIVTIGTNTTLQQLIIEQIKPEYVAIVTGNSDEVKKVAYEFCEYLSAKKIHFDEPRFYKEIDLVRIEQGFDELISWMESKNIQKENIVIDLTGGKTPFSIAAFNSARRNGIHSVYTDSDYDAGKIKAGTQHSILLT
ncbi:hypothetical protein [Sulfuricurvum sp.]|uniref:hypothetical protein n=1 Tax=Sulfuricurvum sp. TaxID=2025608 RepID=UPI00260A3E95|nr:hypothetical protein [Sulfuricurvum sp.]MDD3596353.1 hypothetical protein [Sulfuricurvum sp.]